MSWVEIIALIAFSMNFGLAITTKNVAAGAGWVCAILMLLRGL